MKNSVAVDAVAEAISDASLAGKMFPWSTLNEGERDVWRRMAAAGIAALDAHNSEESR